MAADGDDTKQTVTVSGPDCVVTNLSEPAQQQHVQQPPPVQLEAPAPPPTPPMEINNNLAKHQEPLQPSCPTQPPFELPGRSPPTPPKSLPSTSPPPPASLPATPSPPSRARVFDTPQGGLGGGQLAYATYAPSLLKLDVTRLGALDKAQRYWELQNDVPSEGAKMAPAAEKEARLEMLGRDLISDIHSLIEASAGVERKLKGERLGVWTAGTAIAAGIPAFVWFTQQPLPPAREFATKLSSPSPRVVRRGVDKNSLAALSAATIALSLVPTAIGAVEVAMHERKLGDVQSWSDDLRYLAYGVEKGEQLDGMDMYCLTDERWRELPWHEEVADIQHLCY